MNSGFANGAPVDVVAAVLIDSCAVEPPGELREKIAERGRVEEILLLLPVLLACDVGDVPKQPFI